MFKKLLKFLNKKRKNYYKVKLQMSKLIEKGDINSISFFIEQKIKEGYNKNVLNKIAFSLLKDNYMKIAVLYGEEVLKVEKDVKFMKVLATRYKWLGNLKKYRELEEEIKQIENSIDLKQIKNIYNQEGIKGIKRYLLEKFDKITLKWFSEELKFFLNKPVSKADIEFFIHVSSELFKNDMNFNKQVFITLKDIYTDIAIKYGLVYFNNNKKDYKFASVLALRLMRNERYKEAYQVYNYLYSHDKENREIYENKILMLTSILYRSLIKKLIKKKEKKHLIEYLAEYLPKNLRKDKNFIYKIIFFALKDDLEYTQDAIFFAEKYLESKRDSFIALSLSNLYFKEGRITDAINVKFLDMNDPKTKLKIEHYKAYKNLLENGFKLPPKKEKRDLEKIKVGYCLHNTLPYNSGGYATRSHGLAKGLQLLGFDIQIISRLGYPRDLSSFKNSSSVEELPEIEVIEDLTYYRLFTDINKYGVVPLEKYLKEYGEALFNLAKNLNITILHGASNFMNGIAANYAARKLGIKSIYEVRGLWEITRMSRQPEWENSEHFNMIKRLETEAALNADAVITITSALKNEMIARGVPENKITVVSNGVHTDRFVPKKRVKVLEKKLGYKNKIVIGFIGSIVNYEGLEYLVEAAKILKDKNIKNFAVMIVGDGAVLDDIKKLVKRLKVEDIFTFTGRVPHEEVEDYYSLVDIAPFPRKGLPVCEMVSPIKPFEAMSMAKAVVASNVAALEEIVQEGKTGLLFKKDNPNDLARVLLKLIQDENLRKRLGKNAREWVEKEKDWKILAKKVASVYENVMKQ